MTPPLIDQYSIPPGESLPVKLLRDNQGMAGALKPIDSALACRVGACHPGAYCRAAKYCAICGPIRADMLSRRFKASLASVTKAAHLTLTTRACSELTRRRLDDLARAFVRLRERGRIPSRLTPGGWRLYDPRDVARLKRRLSRGELKT